MSRDLRAVITDASNIELHARSRDAGESEAPVVIGGRSLRSIDDADLRASERLIGSERAHSAGNRVVLRVKRRRASEQRERRDREGEKAARETHAIRSRLRRVGTGWHSSFHGSFLVGDAVH